MVTLHLDNRTAKAYLCNQSGTVSPFLSRLACWILSLTNKHGIALIPAYIPTHLNVEADYLSQDQLLLEWNLLPWVAHAAFHLWGLPEVDLMASSHSTQCQHYYTLETPLPLGGLGVECLQPSLDMSGKLCVSFSGSGPSSSVQVSGRTCQRSTQTFDSGGTMLDGGSLASHSSQYGGRNSSAVFHCKRSHHGCFSRPGAQESAVSAFNSLAAQQCVLHQQGFSSSVCQVLVGASQTSTSKVYQQCWIEWAGWCVQQGLPNNAISAPKLANFLLFLFQAGLVCHTIGIYFSAISAFLEPHWIHKASNHPVMLKLMHHFYLQCPLSHKCFDTWDVEHLLSLLESWAPASSLTTFKLAWKTATLLALVTAKHCSDLTLLCIDNQYFFLQHNAAIFIPMSGGKTDHVGHLPPQICIESHSIVNLFPFLYLKAYFRHTESFRMKPNGSHVTSLFWVTIGSIGLSVLTPFLLG